MNNMKCVNEILVGTYKKRNEKIVKNKLYNETYSISVKLNI